MIIVQTPLRTSLFGGGTDFPAYYLEKGGCVLTSAIDKYIYVIIKRRFDDKLRVGYTRTELVDDVADIRHELIREAMRQTGIERGVELNTMADIPSQGSGLGSSSSVVVGALHAMYALQHRLVTAEQLAREACRIEIEILGKPIGIQDQYVAAYGGLRYFHFAAESGEVTSQAIELDEKIETDLNRNLMLFYTGITRRSDTILAEQQNNIQARGPVLDKMKHLASTAYQELTTGNVDAIGELLHESWLLKKQLASKITNNGLDDLYECARLAGATGGKIAGAGGGGFLLLYCLPEYQDQVRRQLGGLRELPFNFSQNGSKIVFDRQ